MKKSLMISLMVGALVLAFALPSVIAGNAAPDTITMKAPEGMAMKKAPVVFPHKGHVDKGLDCMACHHKAESKEAIKSCASPDCHVKEGKKDPMSFYAAFHSKNNTASCVACHKKEQKGPKACKECHPKK